MKPKFNFLIFTVGFLCVIGFLLSRSSRSLTGPGAETTSEVNERENKQALQKNPGPEPKSFSRSQLEITFAMIEAEQDPMRREELIQAAVKAVEDIDLTAVIAALQNESQTRLAGELQLRLIRRWAANDPATAADWITREISGEARQEAINNVAIEWANQNFWEAIDWAKRLPIADEQQKALLNAAYEEARTAPQDALVAAVDFLEGSAQSELATHAAAQWAAVAPWEAVTWAKQITDDSLREQVLAAVAMAWSDRDPAQAANLAVQALSPGRLQDNAIIAVVQRWAQKQPEAAAAWVNQFPRGLLRDTAIALLPPAVDQLKPAL